MSLVIRYELTVNRFSLLKYKPNYHLRILQDHWIDFLQQVQPHPFFLESISDNEFIGAYSLRMTYGDRGGKETLRKPHPS